MKQGPPSKWLFGFAALLCLTLPSPSGADDKSEDPYCGMLPPNVHEGALYAGWSACDMRRRGELPIWQGMPQGTRQVTRFIFTQGHGMFFRVVRIIEFEDGTAELKVFGTQNRNDYRKPERRTATIRKRLSSEQVDTLSRLATEAGVWDFEVGTWDGAGDDAPLYTHCQLLEMERANAQGYRFSSVNIGCNQPKKLMPLVNEVVRLARMKNTHNGMLFE